MTFLCIKRLNLVKGTKYKWYVLLCEMCKTQETSLGL